jgi:hypothetical protein
MMPAQSSAPELLLTVFKSIACWLHSRGVAVERSRLTVA